MGYKPEPKPIYKQRNKHRDGICCLLPTRDLLLLYRHRKDMKVRRKSLRENKVAVLISEEMDCKLEFATRDK